MAKLFARLELKKGKRPEVKASDQDMFEPLPFEYSPKGTFRTNCLPFMLCSYYIIGAIQIEAGKEASNFLLSLHDGTVKKVLGE
jgi:hypothetical protein